MVGFICFALTGSCYLISLGLVVSFDGLILRFLNLLIFPFSSVSISLFRVLLCPLRLMRLRSLFIFGAFYTLCALRRFDCFLFAIIQGKADEPFCGFKVHRTQPLSLSANWPWMVSGFPLFGLSFRVLPVYRKISDSALDFLCLYPSLVRIYNTTARAPLSRVF